jgi:hypothetical protein
LRLSLQRRAQRHVLDGEGHHHDVVRFHDRRADDEGVGVEQTRRQARGYHVEIVVDQGDGLVPGLAIQVDQLHLLRAPLRRQAVVAELLEPVQRVAGRGLGDDHGAFEARFEVIQNAANRIRVGRRQLVRRRDVVHLDDDVLLGP